MFGGVKGVVTVPNIATVARVVMAAAAAVMALRGVHVAAVSVLIAAALLDAFDGWYARTFSRSSELGAHLDPLADKVLMGVVFAWVGLDAGSPWVWGLVLLVALREISVTALRTFSLRRRGRFIPASRLGRVKMLTQSIVGLTLLSVTHFLGAEIPVRVVVAGMTVVLVASYTSGFAYLKTWWRDEARRREYATGLPEKSEAHRKVSAGR